ncbi:MAG: ATP-binding protein [Terriglobia bacterium]
MRENKAGETRTEQLVLESTLESVDQAERLTLEMAREAGFDEDDLHRIGMSVRECVVNAVVHGNRYDAQKTVDFSVTRSADRFQIRIADQGAGFEIKDLPDPLADENLLRTSGRGIFLIRAFMDEVHVNRLRPEGTEVILIKKTGQT